MELAALTCRSLDTKLKEEQTIPLKIISEVVRPKPKISVKSSSLDEH